MSRKSDLIHLSLVLIAIVPRMAFAQDPTYLDCDLRRTTENGKTYRDFAVRQIYAEFGSSRLLKWSFDESKWQDECRNEKGVRCFFSRYSVIRDRAPTNSDNLEFVDIYFLDFGSREFVGISYFESPDGKVRKFKNKGKCKRITSLPPLVEPAR